MQEPAGSERESGSPAGRGAPWRPAGVVRLLMGLSLALFVGFLFLPVTYGAEALGGMSGMLLVIEGIGLPALVTPLSCLVALRSRPRAAVTAAAGLLLPFYLAATEGFAFDAVLSGQRIFASGLVCWVVSAILMVAAWGLAWMREVPPRR